MCGELELNFLCKIVKKVWLLGFKGQDSETRKYFSFVNRNLGITSNKSTNGNLGELLNAFALLVMAPMTVIWFGYG